MEYFNAFNTISVHPHHVKQNICGTRAKYRDGKKDTAVKVYTINQESVYIIVTNVPAIGGSEELRALCDQYGIIEEFRSLDDYPCEEFTEAYLVKYNSFPSARTAKKYLDDKSFLGSTLHVFYAPEFETVYETRMKLQERRKYIAWKTKKGQNTSQASSSTTKNQIDKSTKPSSSATCVTSIQPVTYVWAGKEYTVYPKTAPSSVEVPVFKEEVKNKMSSNSFVPRQLKQKHSDGSSSSNYTYDSQKIFSSNTNLPNIDESSYLNTISHVRTKISNVSVPNVRVSLKRKRRM